MDEQGLDLEREKRRRIEARLLKTLWRADAHRRLAESNILGVVFADTKGRLSSANDEFVRMLGYSKDEIALGNVRWDDLTPPEYRERDRLALLRVEELGVTNPWEKEVIAKDGRRVPVLVGVALLEGSDYKTIGFVLDLTERRRAEEKAQRLADELGHRNQQLEEDLKMAREVQLSLMPQEYPRFFVPNHPESALRFAHRYLPAATVGGDFFDVTAMSDTRALILVCDVMGHGVRAALVTAMIRTLVTQLKTTVESPGELLEVLNRGLISTLRQSGAPMFASAVCAIVDVKSHSMLLANAGHPSPLHLRRTKKSVELLRPEAPAPALGLVDSEKYLSHAMTLERGDGLMFLTDGLYELDTDPALTLDDIGAMVREKLAHPVEEIFDALLMELPRRSKTQSFDDDVCLVGVELT